MFKGILVLVLLAALASADGDTEVTHRFIENVAGHRFHSIYTTDSNIALTDLLLSNVKWMTVSINGDQVVIYSPSCDVYPKNIQDFTQEEKQMLGAIMAKFMKNGIDIEYKAQNTLLTNKIEILGRGEASEIINRNTNIRTRTIDTWSLGALIDRLNEMPLENRPIFPGFPVDDKGRYDLPRDELGFVKPLDKPISLDVGGNLNKDQMNVVFGEPPKGLFLRQKDVSVLSLDEENFSIAKSGLPDDLARVFLNKEVTTFVYNDNRVIMKPTFCLSVDEHELLDQLRKDMKEVSSSYSDDW